MQNIYLSSFNPEEFYGDKSQQKSQRVNQAKHAYLLSITNIMMSQYPINLFTYGGIYSPLKHYF